jgi:hypothetical protein
MSINITDAVRTLKDCGVASDKIVKFIMSTDDETALDRFLNRGKRRLNSLAKTATKLTDAE